MMAMNPMVRMMSCAVAATAASPKRHSKRTARYASTAKKERKMAIKALVRSSPATLGPAAPKRSRV